jgi:hypothetical protein
VNCNGLIDLDHANAAWRCDFGGLIAWVTETPISIEIPIAARADQNLVSGRCITDGLANSTTWRFIAPAERAVDPVVCYMNAATREGIFGLKRNNHCQTED